MKNPSFKSLICLLSLSMIFTILTPAAAFANEPTTNILQTENVSIDNYDLDTVKDNKLETIIETKEDDKKIRSTYNKVTQIITITTEG